MKRALIFFLAASPLLMGIGCGRRAGSPPRDPVHLTVEKDLPVPKGGGNKAAKVVNRDNLIKLYVEDMAELEKRKASKKELESYLAKQAEADRKGEGRALETKMELAETTVEISAFGRACLDFCKKNPPKEYTTTNLSQYLRRNSKTLFIRRRFLDKSKYEIFTEDVTLRSLLADEEAFEIVFEADVSSPEDVLVYKKDRNDNNVAFLCKQAIVLMPWDENLQPRICQQQLKALWNSYALYTRDVPADQRSLAGLKKTLGDNAPPSLSDLIQRGTIKVADPRAGAEWLACHVKEFNGKKGGFLALKMDGQMGYLTNEQVKAAFK